MTQKQIIVVAGIIYHKDQFLIVQRSLDKSDLQPGLWEFPGGKVEWGEDPKDALIREIQEELNLEISDLSLFDVTSGEFHKDEKKIHATMIIFTSKTLGRNLCLNSGNDYRWIYPKDLLDYELAKLDIPILRKIDLL